MSLPHQHPFSTTSRLTLAEAVARTRWPRNRATMKLAPHREELLRLRAEGMSVGALMGGLRELGVEIGHETLRLWLMRESGQRPVKRRKGKSRRAATPNIGVAIEGGQAVAAITPPA